MALTADRRLIVSGLHRELQVFDLDRRTRLAALEVPSPFRALRVSADGSRVLALGSVGPPSAPVLLSLENYGIIASLAANGFVFSARFARWRRIATGASSWWPR